MVMAKLGKRTAKIREGVDPAKAYSVDDAVKMVKERAKAKFDETIEIAMNLGVDPKHADQMVRGVVTCRTAPAAPSASACSRAAPRPTRPRPPAPTWSARRIWSRRSTAARSTSTAASPRPT